MIFLLTRMLMLYADNLDTPLMVFLIFFCIINFIFYRSCISYKSYFGAGNASILLNDVTCNGNESSLFQCSHTIFPNDCDRTKIVGIICSDIGRL